MALANWMLDLGQSLEVERRWIPVDGHRVYHWKAGTGPELILLHGLLGTASAWEPMAPSLAAEATIYALDALGMGESERVPGIDPGLRAQAERVAGFMDGAGIHSADILGTSHGGSVALMLAASHPERVRSLILHAPANPFSTIADPLIHFYQTRVGRWCARHYLKMPNPLKSLALARMYGNSVPVQQKALERYLGSLRRPGTVDYVLSLLGGWFEDMRILEGALRAVRHVPTLLLWGDCDRAVSLESANALQSCFDQVQLVVLPGTGHLPYEECPAIFGQAIQSFLRSRRVRLVDQGFQP